MGLSIADAYSQIKNLENSGQLSLPETQDTVAVGLIDPAAGTFTFSAPTVTQTIQLPPVMGKPQFPLELTVGVVATQAVDLLLKFNVVPQQMQEVNAPVSTTGTASGGGGAASPGSSGMATVSSGMMGMAKSAAVAGSAVMAVAKPVATASASGSAPAPAGGAQPTESPALHLGSGNLLGINGGNSLLETNGGVTISGFPTVASAADHITVDAGLVCSMATGDPTVTPPVSFFTVTINFVNHPAIEVRLFILRPPAVGLGAFTIPALPMTIVYAPPQGAQNKNTAVYSDTETLTRSVTSSITDSTNTKTVQAYTAADLIGKVAGAITAVAAVVGTGGAGAAGGASVAGALSQLGSALFGGAQSANDSTADATKQVSSELTLVSDILTGIDDSTSQDGQTITVENDQSLTLTTSSMDSYGSAAGQAAGVGDRIVYFSNVKVVWMAVNGELGINILGYDQIAAHSVQDIQQELANINNGQPPTLNLDVVSLQSLLNLDPLVPNPKRTILGLNELEPAVIGPPRFVPAAPPGRSGSSTGPGGDVVTVSYETTTEDKQVNTNAQTTITDAKPGWLAVLFGADNTETTSTSTLTNTVTTDNKTDDKLTSTITFFSESLSDPYDVKIFYDCTFGTYVIVDSTSELLQGSAGFQQAAWGNPSGSENR